MKSILTVLFALSLASFPTLNADTPAKVGTKKTAEPKFVYFEGSFTKFHPGNNVGIGKDHTIFATKNGKVAFKKTRIRTFISVIPA